MADRRSLMTRGLQAVAQIATPAQQPPGSKIGWTPGTKPERTVATPTSTPQPTQGKAEARSFVDTYFTKSGTTDIVYNGDRQWARVTLLLETAGPVSVGVQQSIAPVNSGKGQLLRTGVPYTVTIAKGTRLYIVATGVNRVSRTVEPVPWLEQITGILLSLLGRR